MATAAYVVGKLAASSFHPSSWIPPSNAKESKCKRIQLQKEVYRLAGEALSSLCAVAEVSVVTRTAGQDAATRLEFDRAGAIAGRAAGARAVGTTVAVKDVFRPLPVRHRELQKNVKREYARLVALLQVWRRPLMGYFSLLISMCFLPQPYQFNPQLRVDFARCPQRAVPMTARFHRFCAPHCPAVRYRNSFVAHYLRLLMRGLGA